MQHDGTTTSPPAPPPPETQAPSITAVFAEVQEKLVGAVPGIISGLIVFAVFYLIARVGQRLIALTAPRVKADTGVVLLLSRVYYYGVLTFGAITALGTAGLNVSALIAGLGLTGFALGFALKDVLSNLVSGIMLLIYRPFNIGDQIRMGEHEGTIETIRMRDTVVRGYDGRHIIIPNTKLITEVVINHSAAPFVRQAVSFGLPAGTDPDRAREIFNTSMLSLPEARGRFESVVAVRDPEGRGLRLDCNFWYDPRKTDGARMAESVIQAAARGFEEVGISVTTVTAPRDGRPARAAEDEEEQAPATRAAPGAEERVAAEARAHDNVS